MTNKDLFDKAVVIKNKIDEIKTDLDIRPISIDEYIEIEKNPYIPYFIKEAEWWR